MLTKCFMLAVVAALPVALIVVNWVIANNLLTSRETLSTFECGFDAHSSARVPFSLHFFLLGVIFIVFDLEILLLMPLPLLTQWTSTTILVILSFMIVLYFGTLHEWHEGSLSWV